MAERSGARGEDRIDQLIDKAARDRRVSHQQPVEQGAEDQVQGKIDVARCGDQTGLDTALDRFRMVACPFGYRWLPALTKEVVSPQAMQKRSTRMLEGGKVE